MIFYRVLCHSSGSLDYSHHVTLADAHHVARGYSASDRPFVYVEQIDVPTDKAGILDLLRGYSPTEDFPAVRSWTLTSRGGLREAANPTEATAA